MFKLLIAPTCLILLSTNLHEYGGGFSRAGESVAQVIPRTELRQERPSLTPAGEISKAPETVNTTIPVALPVNATVWLKAGGSITGQVKGFDAKQQSLTLGEESIQLARIGKVAFDRKSLAYKSDGKTVIRGDDTAKAQQSTWQNILLSAFQLKDPKLGQAQVNLVGIMEPLELRSIRSIAVKSMYVVDEIQFQPTGKMMIKVTPSDR